LKSPGDFWFSLFTIPGIVAAVNHNWFIVDAARRPAV